MLLEKYFSKNKNANINFNRLISNVLNSKYIFYILSIMTIIASYLTYQSFFSNDLEFGPDPAKVTRIVLFDFTLLLLFTIFISKKIFKLWIERKHGITGSRLQTKIILMFSFIAAVPVIIVSIFTILFFKQGVSTWFDDRVSVAINESVAVANAYYEEHKKNIRRDVISIANELDNDAYKLISNNILLKSRLVDYANKRGLIDVTIYQPSTTNVISSSNFLISLAFDLLNNNGIDNIKSEEIYIIESKQDDRLKAIVKLDNFYDSYLIISNFVDKKVIAHTQKAIGSANEYQRLKDDIANTQLRFLAIFIIFTFILMLIATWLGMFFSVSIVRPISRLVNNTKEVESGKVNIEIADGPEDDEIAILGRAFDSMLKKLSNNRYQLIQTNVILDERKRFIEAILEGVTAGIIALDKNKEITLINKSAKEILSVKENHKRDIFHLLPGINFLFDEILDSGEYSAIKEIKIKVKGRLRTLLTRLITEHQDNEIEGYIISFDDITELLSAQRSLAWSDVARRIAHEIKNPLTPIHLSIDRLKKKYIAEINDKENFIKYLDTIIRHVKNIGSIVEEFVHFARMPTPVFHKQNIISLAKNCVFSQELIKNDIDYSIDTDYKEMMVSCDDDQINQVFTNLLKNAEEAINESDKKINEKKITISITAKENLCIITIKDTGKGFPENLLNQITEPYVTTRKKGTGLGLAIVKKIIEDHNGNIALGNWSGGAYVKVTLPYYKHDLLEA